MRIVDLSQPIYHEMPVHPMDEPVSLTQTKFLQPNGFNGFRLETGLHAGTHMDAPSHLMDSPITIGDIPLERCVGRGRLLDVRGIETITAAHGEHAPIEPGDIVLLYTGFDRHYGEPAYYREHPLVDASFGQLLVERGAAAVGMDLFSPDKMPYPFHTLLMSQGMPILENLTHLEQLLSVPHFTVVALPLNMAAEASPVRVVALIEK